MTRMTLSCKHCNTLNAMIQRNRVKVQCETLFKYSEML